MRKPRDAFVNYNLNIRFMKKLFYCLLVGASLVLTTEAHAQFRSLPAAVTDSFKAKYPSAQQVSWSDKLSAWQVSFKQDTSSCTARFKNTGEWQWSTRKMSQTSLPSAVQDGYSKSKYAGDWKVGNVMERDLPGSIVQYVVSISKSDLQRRILVFSSVGQLLKDGNTL